ncbi:ATP-binding protein [Gracilibacillus alcaliphilus]|uniref:ATP-binding protein n=1 Tax=Gracilibacillus alcaliphilus TaxID=1401441 RepID=UPI00195774E0|nr:ATP-binding protein [Gracilibacillus alcaliphilus]MBM7677901.1 signal transduction histidine kinase [Gracilibacillus alcaliphilus]
MKNKSIATYIKIFTVLLLFFACLITFRLIWINYYNKEDQPVIQDGVLDLTNWDFSSEETISLNGEWLFYPNQFIEAASADKANQTLIQVPGDWRAEFLTADSDRSNNYGYGSYYVKVLLPETSPSFLGLRMNSIQTAVNIIVNGQLIDSVNRPSDRKLEQSHVRGPITSLFYADPDNNELEIILQVSNYELPFTGGISRSISFGAGEAVNQETNLSQFLQLSVIILVFLHALYAFAIFFMNKGKPQTELIYFGFMSLLIGLGNLLDDEVFVQLPLSIDLTYRIVIVIYVLVLFVLIKFIQHLYQIRQGFIKVLAVINLVMAGLILTVIPLDAFTVMSGIMLVNNAVAISYLFIITFKQVLHGDKDGILILLVICSYTSNAIWGAAIQTGQIEFPFYPFDFFVPVILVAILLIKRHIQLAQLTEKQAARLIEEDRKKDEFLANTSHEIRNPLHGMVNIAQSIINNQGNTLDRETVSNLQLLTQIGHRLTFTLNDILDITRLKEQKILLQREAVPLHTITDGVIEMVRFTSPNKPVTLHNEIEMSFPPLYADENRLIRILFNLIHNAVKYTEKGKVVISATEQEDMAVIAVQDTGVGIDQDALDRIFLPYEKLSKSDVDRGGIGLGLNICRQLVELHGGEIGVESKLGKGTTFTFSIPLASQMNQNYTELELARKEQSSFYHDLTNETIVIHDQLSVENKPLLLVVDDDPINLKVMQNLLEPNYQLHCTTDPRVAMEWVEKESYDLVISDVMMSPFSGYELTKRIRERFTISELPVLLLTARNQTEDIYTGFVSGANDYIAKPVVALELQARVKALTDLSSSINEQLRIEAAWLQAQIKPHFIFNTLNTIASLSNVDIERMINLLNEFGRYLSKSFDTRNTKPLVPLQEELELVDSYIYINQQRFMEKLTVHKKFDDYQHIFVPPLSIQTLVENAIKHGIVSQHKSGTLWLQGKQLADSYQIKIIDDGMGIPAEILASLLNKNIKKYGVGLINTDQRWRKLFGQGIKIKSVEGKGTEIAMSIPKRANK